MNTRHRLLLFFVAALPLGLTTGCQNAAISDSFFSEDQGWSDHGFLGTAALYVPNRVIDLLDILHVGVGVGPGLGVGLHATRDGYALMDAGVNAGFGWFGRYARPYRRGLYVRVSAAGFTPPGQLPDTVNWHVPRNDISLFADALLVQAYAGFAPDEFLDFFTGLSTYDLKNDDW